jgi:hypothetical protein
MTKSFPALSDKSTVKLTRDEHVARALLLGYHYDSDLHIYRSYTVFGIWIGPDFDADTMEVLSDGEFKKRWSMWCRTIDGFDP